MILHSAPFDSDYLSLDEHDHQLLLCRAITRLCVAQTTICRSMRTAVTTPARRKQSPLANHGVSPLGRSTLDYFWFIFFKFR